MQRYEDLEAEMDAQVEYHLGDSISYIVGGDGAPITIVGFLEFSGDEGGIDGIDPVRRRWTAQIAMARLPAGPQREDRLTHRRLRNVLYKPSTGTIRNDGVDYFFDIQKA